MAPARKTNIGTLLVAIMLAGFAGFFMSGGPRSRIAGFDRGTHAKYEKISEGDSKKAVIEALGEPQKKSDKFNLLERDAFAHLFEAAEKSSAVEYHQWINGMNWYYFIGFDSSGTVVIKGEGNS